ncbi:MAG: diguanylate cyclase [Bdellovibrionaceae bacterium]|jgi:two-component system, cell cycle response regulator|nr:diguanylate cyclase [Pseudobdellovibrionaceae bacterium]
MAKKKDSEKSDDTNLDRFTNTAKLSKKDRMALENDMRLASSMSAVLIIVRGYPQGQKINLDNNKYVIGRDPNVDICFDDKIVSSKHAEITKIDNEFYIRDCGSTNGIFINNEKIKGKVKLKKEDMIKVGTNVLKFIPEGELETMYLGSLADAANLDSLTGVFNRHYMEQALNAEFKRAKALKRKLSFMVFDIDTFKVVNDSHGHDMGDFVLKEISNLVSSSLRENEIFGRYGGDEFVVLLYDTSENGAVKVAEQVRSTVDNHSFEYNGKKLKITVSVGVAELDSSYKEAVDLYRSADEALYQSKGFGRNRVSVYIPGLKDKKKAS